MSVNDKISKKILSKPARTDITEFELHKFLRYYGFEYYKTEGSHKYYKHPKLSTPYVLPCHGRKIKSGYIKELQQQIEKHNIYPI